MISFIFCCSPAPATCSRQMIYFSIHNWPLVSGSVIPRGLSFCISLSRTAASETVWISFYILIFSKSLCLPVWRSVRRPQHWCSQDRLNRYWSWHTASPSFPLLLFYSSCWYDTDIGKNSLSPPQSHSRSDLTECLVPTAMRNTRHPMLRISVPIYPLTPSL